MWKNILLPRLAETSFKEITLDDLQLRNLANRNQALFLEQFKQGDYRTKTPVFLRLMEK